MVDATHPQQVADGQPIAPSTAPQRAGTPAPAAPTQVEAKSLSPEPPPASGAAQATPQVPPHNGGQPVLGSLPQVALGIAVLLSERLRTDVGVAGTPVVGDTSAFAVGLASSTASAVSHTAQAIVDAGRRPAGAVSAATRKVVSYPVIAKAVAPARRAGSGVASRVSSSAGATVEHGRAISADARIQALQFLQSESSNSLGWVRTQVLPVIVDDLATDPKVRELVVEQTQGVFTDATREVRERSAGADERLEDGIRRLFGRRG